jgi:hypothetical protein
VLLAKTGLNKRNGGSCKKIIGEEKNRFIFPFVFSFFRRKSHLQNLLSAEFILDGALYHWKSRAKTRNPLKNFK